MLKGVCRDNTGVTAVCVSISFKELLFLPYLMLYVLFQPNTPLSVKPPYFHKYKTFIYTMQ